MKKKIGDIWIYRLKKVPLIIPDDLTVDYEFIKNYAKISSIGNSKFILKFLDDETILLEATLKGKIDYPLGN